MIEMAFFIQKCYENTSEMRLLLFYVLAFGVCYHADAEFSRIAKGRQLQCGGTGKSKHLEMQSPSQLPAECVYKIQPLNMNVCQLHVDFDVILQQPTTPKGTEKGIPKCDNDSFTIAGLELCGINRNQHVYIPLHVSRGSRRQTIEIKLKIADRQKNPMLSFVTWNIRVTQLECARGASSVITGRHLNDTLPPMNPSMARTISEDANLLAPHGCLQYHTGLTGTIESFNFNAGFGPYPPNLNYAICLRRRFDNTKIEFTFNSFHLASVKTEAEGFDENCLVKSVVPSKPSDKATETSEDYLMIPSAITAKQMRVNKFCGNTINTQNATANAPGPYVLQFHSDDKFKVPDAKAMEGGFNIKYQIQ